MLTLFIAAFCVLFAALSVAYLLMQRRQARLVWVPVYVFLVWELAELMNWSNEQLADRRIYLEVGHASIVLIAVLLLWLLLAVLVLLASWFNLLPKRTS